MLRNAEFRQKSTAEILQKIDTILSSQHKRTFKCQLMFIKGFFLWTNDQEAALDLWLMAMEEATDFNINVRLFDLLQNQVTGILFSSFLVSLSSWRRTIFVF